MYGDSGEDIENTPHPYAQTLDLGDAPDNEDPEDLRGNSIHLGLLDLGDATADNSIEAEQFSPDIPLKDKVEVKELESEPLDKLIDLLKKSNLVSEELLITPIWEEKIITPQALHELCDKKKIKRI